MLAAMRNLVALISACILSTFVNTAEAACSGKVSIGFPLTASQSSYSADLDGRFVLHVAKDPDGWEVGVFRKADHRFRDNLLYPGRNWHGAFPCQIVALVDPDIFPNERVIPIRGTKKVVCVRLIDPVVAGSGDQRYFSAGHVEVVGDGS